jgi:hypothetical protein
LTTQKVRWWSDFNRVYYHPRSSIQLNQYQLDLSPFNSFSQGRDLFRDVDKVVPSVCGRLLIQDDELLDKDIRAFAEECDSLQGFQVILDSHSAWTGFSAEYISAIRAEYPKSSIWTWGIESNSVTPRTPGRTKGRRTPHRDFPWHNYCRLRIRIYRFTYPCVCLKESLHRYHWIPLHIGISPHCFHSLTILLPCPLALDPTILMQRACTI